MATFAGLLGSAAQGFNQAHQIDQQRQFENEQNMRQQALQHLFTIANNPDALPEARNAAIRGGLQITQTPMGKFNQATLGKVLASVIQPATPATTVQGQSQQFNITPPPAPPQTGQGSGPPLAGMVPGGAPPQAVALPPIPTQATLAGTPGGVFMTPEQIGQHQATILGAQSKAQLEAGFQARQEAMNAFIQAHPEIANDPMFRQIAPFMAMGMSTPYGMWQGQMAGPSKQMTAGQARNDPRYAAMVPAPLGDNELVNLQFSRNMQPLGIMPVTPSSLLASQHAGFKVMSDADGNQFLVPVTEETRKVLPNGQTAGGQGQPAKPTAGKSGGKALPAVPTLAGTGTGTPTASNMPKGAIPFGHKPIPPETQRKIRESLVARDSAVGLIDDVLKNINVFDSLWSAGKISVATDPSTGNDILTRAADLTDQEARVAGDMSQLIEHVNLLRGPLGATGFRSKESWEALQAQRGRILQDPRITQQVLTGMRDRLAGLQKADMDVLAGKGTQINNPPPPPFSSSSHKVGDVVTIHGQKIKISAIHPDGTFDGDPVK